MNKISTKKGFSIIETVIYIAIFGMVLIFIISSIIYVGKAYSVLKAERSMASSASAILDRVARGIRDAEVIDVSGSVFDANLGSLTLQPFSTYFFIENGILKVQEGASTPGALTSGEVQVSELIFSRVETAQSEGVKISLELEMHVDGLVRTKRFYSTAVLRGSY